MRQLVNRIIKFGVALLLMSSWCAAQTWDLGNDFSLDKNSNGAWTFGWVAKPGDKLNNYDLLWGTQKGIEPKGFWSPGWFGPVRAWCKERSDASKMLSALPPPGTLPYPDHWVEANFQGEEAVAQAAGLPSYPDPFGFVSKNTSEGPFASWGYNWEPRSVILMPPGKQGKAARVVARWTAPSDCRVVVKCRFTGERYQGDAGMGADLCVLHNGKPIYADSIYGFIGTDAFGYDDALGKTPQQEWANAISVARGDTIDFSVGCLKGFNYNIFGIQNKQMLPGVGLTANISVVDDDIATARGWAAAKFEGVSEAKPRSPGLASYGASSSESSFSFIYDGRPFSELVKTFKLEHSSRELDKQRTEHTLSYTDPKTGLVARCVGVEYHDFPTVEWTVYLKNTGSTDTPIIENVQALDLGVERGAVGEFVLHRMVDNKLVANRLGPNASKRLVDPFPYFNLELPGECLIVSLGWPGSLGFEFTRDAGRNLRVRGGQKLTHFRLRPGEEVRTPLVVMQFSTGDQIHAQNIWRRWMIAHNMPKPGGNPLPPQLSASSAYFYGNMVFANEENQKMFIDRYVQEKLQPDYWWMDAGWYPPNITRIGNQPVGGWCFTGTWEVDKTRFPNGLKAITDLAHSHGIKSILWFQPERVSPGTWLDKQHPEWLLGANGADKLFNFGDPDARQWAVDHFSKLLKDEGIDIYRMDTNVAFEPFWTANDAQDRQGITEIKHVMGYLSYLDELQKRNPNVRLDHWRTDLETLRRTAPLILGIDFEPVGDQCHNYRLASWIPWHGLCTRVIEPYAFRSMMCPAVAMGWDMRRNDLDYNLARRLIAQWREVAPNYMGDYYPLTPYSYDSSVWMAWQFNRPEVGEGIVQAFRRVDCMEKSSRFKLRGLDPDARYILSDLDAGKPRETTGRELMEQGLTISLGNRPAASVVLYRKAK